MAIYIAVIGPSRASPEIAEAAFQVGALIAGGGAILVCGGGGGAMEAACRGARSAGGTTVGILPGPTREDANSFVDIAIPTGMGEARNALVVRAADAVIAVGGGVGTLSEIGLALKMGRPVIGLRTWEVAPPAEDAVQIAIERVESPEAAASAALAAATKHFC
ncbi:MAG: putative Rossmann fold nucleotide-binding protein [Actinobacteria bacterium]|nr:putative Rossmann fold nucleotide-binding protein [Actinomycetota bacterium]